MPRQPWKNYIKPEEDRHYIVLLTYLPLKHAWRIPQLLRHVSRINKQLDTASGIVAYSLDAELTRKRFWTLSVWQDEEALYNFVKTQPHAATMTKIRPHIRNPKFIKWMAKGSDVPPNWEDAKTHFTTKAPT